MTKYAVRIAVPAFLWLAEAAVPFEVPSAATVDAACAGAATTDVRRFVFPNKAGVSSGWFAFPSCFRVLRSASAAFLLAADGHLTDGWLGNLHHHWRHGRRDTNY